MNIGLPRGYLHVAILLSACAPDVGASGMDPLCGNGVLDGLEACDGSNLNGATCGPGYESGRLACTADCELSYAQCEVAPTSVVIEDVSSVTVSHGQSITISGSGFGAKSQAAPLKFDDFEGGAAGAIISGWDSVNTPYYSSEAAHAGTQGMTSAFAEGVYNSSVRLDADFSRGFYLDAWYRYAPANPASRNNKLFLVYGSGGATNAVDMPQVHYAGWCDLDASIAFDTRAALDKGTMAYTSLSQNDLVGGELKHLQVWMDPGTPGVANGVIWAASDGVVTEERADVLAYMPGEGVWNSVRIGYYVAHDGVAGCEAAGDAYSYWDDVYLDNTQARVELGDHPIYEQATHREIQLPTTWGDGSISFTVNRGAFESGDEVYAFVVTAAGARSAGALVTVE